MKKHTRDQIVALVGASIINRLDTLNCEPTNRCGYNGVCQGDELTEWAASINAGNDEDGISRTVTAYYYTTNAEVEAAGDDLGNITWRVDHYTLA